MSTLNTLLSGGVKSVQRGTLRCTGGVSTVVVNVAAVNPAKAVLVPCGFTADGSQSGSSPLSAEMVRIELINGSQIQATRNTINIANTGYTYAWQLIEFY